RIGAIDRGGRGVGEMRRLIMPASLQNVGKTDDVRLHIIMRMGEAVAHTRLGGEMDNALEAVGSENGVDGSPIRQIGADKGPAARRSGGCIVQDRKPRLLQGRVVVVIDGIVADDFIAALDQLLCDMKADKTRRPRDEVSHGRSLSSLSALAKA